MTAFDLGWDGKNGLVNYTNYEMTIQYPLDGAIFVLLCPHYFSPITNKHYFKKIFYYSFYYFISAPHYFQHVITINYLFKKYSRPLPGKLMVTPYDRLMMKLNCVRYDTHHSPTMSCEG